jgi:hypothetical protein
MTCVARSIVARGLGQLLLDLPTTPLRHMRFIYRLESVSLLSDVFRNLDEWTDYAQSCQTLVTTLMGAADLIHGWEFVYAFLDALWSNHESDLIVTLEPFSHLEVARSIVDVLLQLGLTVSDKPRVTQWVSDLIGCMLEREKIFGIAAMVPGESARVRRARAWVEDRYQSIADTDYLDLD